MGWHRLGIYGWYLQMIQQSSKPINQLIYMIHFQEHQNREQKFSFEQFFIQVSSSLPQHRHPQITIGQSSPLTALICTTLLSELLRQPRQTTKEMEIGARHRHKCGVVAGVEYI